MSVSFLSDKLLQIQQLAHPLLQMQPVTVHQVISSLGKTTFCANGHAQLCQLCHVIQSDMLDVCHSSAHLFCSFHFPSSTKSALETVSVATESSSHVISSS